MTNLSISKQILRQDFIWRYFWENQKSIFYLQVLL